MKDELRQHLSVIMLGGKWYDHPDLVHFPAHNIAIESYFGTEKSVDAPIMSQEQRNARAQIKRNPERARVAAALASREEVREAAQLANAQRCKRQANELVSEKDRATSWVKLREDADTLAAERSAKKQKRGEHLILAASEIDPEDKLAKINSNWIADSLIFSNTVP